MTTKTKNPEIGIKTMEFGEAEVFKRADNFASLYVNSALFGFTKWDFQMMLGRVEISRDENHNLAKEVATVTMTPQYAKALLVDFARIISQYEEQHGEIDLGFNVVELFEKAETKKK